jgi:hypothetical protein
MTSSPRDQRLVEWTERALDLLLRLCFTPGARPSSLPVHHFAGLLVRLQTPSTTAWWPLLIELELWERRHRDTLAALAHPPLAAELRNILETP